MNVNKSSDIHTAPINNEGFLPTAQGTLVWPFIVIIIVIILLYLEYRDISTADSILDLNQIINQEQESPPKSNVEQLDQLTKRLRKNHLIINWRRSLLISIILAILILFYLYPSQIPSGFTVFIATAIIFTILYFSENWFNAHFWLMNDVKIEKEFDILRSSLLNQQNT